MSGASAELVERGDLDDLVRHVDRLTEAGAWTELVDLRDRCRKALERGKQLWPVASLCEYRAALAAPAEIAAGVVREGAGRFAPGPLTEVVASTHTWEEVAAHLPDSALRSVVAQERVVRGDDLRSVELRRPVIDLPRRLEPWEPRYPLAEYREDGLTVEPPPLPERQAIALRDAHEPHADVRVSDALLELIRPWLTDSNGKAEVVAVEGTAEGAIAALGVPLARAAELSVGQAVAYLAWTGASGGAHGRRRGAAAGRFNAWWALAALGGLDDAWPPDADELGEAGGELRWLWWDANEPEVGWQFQLAVEDPADGLAWAITASDLRS